MDIELIVIGMAWVGIALMFAWGATVALYRLFADQVAPQVNMSAIPTHAMPITMSSISMRQRYTLEASRS